MGVFARDMYARNASSSTPNTRSRTEGLFKLVFLRYLLFSVIRVVPRASPQNVIVVI